MWPNTMDYFLINQKNWENQRFWFFWFFCILWLFDMVYKHPTSTKFSVQLNFSLQVAKQIGSKLCGGSVTKKKGKQFTIASYSMMQLVVASW